MGIAWWWVRHKWWCLGTVDGCLGFVGLWRGERQRERATWIYCQWKLRFWRGRWRQLLWSLPIIEGKSWIYHGCVSVGVLELVELLVWGVVGSWWFFLLLFLKRRWQEKQNKRERSVFCWIIYGRFLSSMWEFELDVFFFLSFKSTLKIIFFSPLDIKILICSPLHVLYTNIFIYNTKVSEHIELKIKIKFIIFLKFKLD